MMLSITCSIGGMFFFSVDYHQQKGNLVILLIMLKWAAAAGLLIQSKIFSEIMLSIKDSLVWNESYYY